MVFSFQFSVKRGQGGVCAIIGEGGHPEIFSQGQGAAGPLLVCGNTVIIKRV